jgi:hypothetical protein
MLSQEVINETVARISLMPFFPSSDPGARAIITKEIIQMATSDEQVIWLGYRMQQLYPKQWPGIVELRACFCKRFKPADGVEVNTATYFQEGGFPTEAELGPVPGLCLPPTLSEREALAAGTTPLLEAGSSTGKTLQIVGRVEKMAEADLEQLHNETVGALLESTAPIQPSRRDWIAAKRLAAILDGNGDEATKLTAQLAAMNPRTAEEREAIKAAEREIAEAKPTLTEEEKTRRIAEIEIALGKGKTA